jgi:serine/threonine protein kinase
MRSWVTVVGPAVPLEARACGADMTSRTDPGDIAISCRSQGVGSEVTSLSVTGRPRTRNQVGYELALRLRSSEVFLGFENSEPVRSAIVTVPHVRGFHTGALLGSGSFGDVYLLNPVGIGQPRALKVLHGYLCDEPGVPDTFLQEGRKLATVRHPHIVRGFGTVGTADGRPAFFMEYVPGTNLRYLIDERRTQQVPFFVVELLPILTGLAAAVDHLQSKHGLAHLDIRPENILLSRENKHRAVLGDLGLSRRTLVSRQYKFNMGPYSAPETTNGRDLRWADQFSLAVVILEMLCGKLSANELHPLGPWRKEVPWPLQTAIAQALNLEPEQRFDTAGEFITTLGTLARFTPKNASRKLLAVGVVAGLSGIAAMSIAQRITQQGIKNQL